MSDFTITPSDATTPKLELAASGFRQGRRSRTQATQKEGVVAGTGSFAAAESLNPGEFKISGIFRGSSAEDAAKSLRNDFIDDGSVEEIDIAVQDNADPLEDGTYVLERGDASRLHRRISQLYKWHLILVKT